MKPEVVIIAGPNGSGKSTYTEYIVGPNQFADETYEYINADNIQLALNCDPLRAAEIATQKRETALEKRINFAFETVLSTRRNLDLLIKAKEKGYFIRCFYFLTTSSKININRIDTRVADGGHSVPKEKVLSRYKKSISLIPELISVCDSINIWDNSSDMPYRIFRKKKGLATYFDNPIWDKKSVCDITGLSL